MELDALVMIYGRILLKLCNKHNLKIANGQTPDRIGNYTVSIVEEQVQLTTY